jgi:toxin YoeB
MIRDAQQNPYEGLGRPRALQLEWAGFWTREITSKHRLIYRVRNGMLEIARCCDHYDP